MLMNSSDSTNQVPAKQEIRLTNEFLTIDKEYAGDLIQGGRDYQEDNFGFDNSRSFDFLMVLADGMGGHQGGAEASNCAIKSFMNSYNIAKGSVTKRLKEALEITNQQVGIEAKSDPNLKGMGCTLVAVVFNGEQLEWISVGDSPLWLYNSKGLRRLNADHSMKPILKEQVQRGQLTSKAAAKHSLRNMLLSAITGAPIKLIDQSSIKCYPGDCILLASDGLFTLSDDKIGNILSQSLPSNKSVKYLLDAITKKMNKNQDNTTALVLHIPDKTQIDKASKNNILKRVINYFKSKKFIPKISLG
jgi:serine/threonine protein phosphatase PrpC